MNNEVVNTWLMLNLKFQIEGILKAELPRFYGNVKLSKYTRSSGEREYMHIQIAASDHEINNVKCQYPQYVSLHLEEGTLSICQYGGMGGQYIDLIPNKEDPKECYLAIKRLKIPFRKPKQGDQEAILKAIRKFCQNYKAALIENKARLYNSDIVDYDYLLG